MRRVAIIGILLGSIAVSVMADSSTKDKKSPAEKVEDNTETRPLFMFVQTASSGSFSPITDKPGHFRLTLQGVSPQTIFFSDRPERITGQAPTDKFLKGLGFSKENPPNAALSLLEAGEMNDVVIVELLSPDYDAKQEALSYEVVVLKDSDNGLAIFSEKADESLPPSFSAASLFIDDCSNGVYCLNLNECQIAGYLPNAGNCFSIGTLGCGPCSPGPDTALCNQQFSGCAGGCQVTSVPLMGLICNSP